MDRYFSLFFQINQSLKEKNNFFNLSFPTKKEYFVNKDDGSTNESIFFDITFDKTLLTLHHHRHHLLFP